jgi:hypothetical protein
MRRQSPRIKQASQSRVDHRSFWANLPQQIAQVVRVEDVCVKKRLDRALEFLRNSDANPALPWR